VLSALPVPHPEQLVLLTSPGNLKNGSTRSNNSGSWDYIFNWRAFANWKNIPKRRRGRLLHNGE